MSRPLVVLAALIVGLSALASAAPMLAQMADAAVPLILTLGSVAVVLRLVWYFTRRY